MLTPVLIYLPEPIGWIALTPDALQEAQRLAAAALSTHKATDESSTQPAEARNCVAGEDAARALGVDASWLMRQARMRKVPFLKVGKYVRFDIDTLRTHLAKGLR